MPISKCSLHTLAVYHNGYSRTPTVNTIPPEEKQVCGVLYLNCFIYVGRQHFKPWSIFFWNIYSGRYPSTVVPSVANGEIKQSSPAVQGIFWTCKSVSSSIRSLFINFVVKITVLVHLPHASISGMAHHSAESQI